MLDVREIQYCRCVGQPEGHVLTYAQRQTCRCSWSPPELVQQEQQVQKRKEKAYAFRRHFNEKPSIIPGCPSQQVHSWLTEVRI